MRNLTLATRNRHKTRELATLLGPAWTVEDMSAHPDLPEPVEDGATFEANARIKALAAASALPGLMLADDSGLEVDLLNGAPGIYSARYAGEKPTDEQNRRKVLDTIAAITEKNPPANNPLTARFRCVIAIAENAKILATFHGTVEGLITLTQAGEGGFGYDPIFIPEGHNTTFAQLDPAIKNSISHRARAMQQAAQWLAQNP
jgi:XTP/dITP diphosphohydrolase